jgi:thiol-disulfide isomerase/thioredoxin
MHQSVSITMMTIALTVPLAAIAGDRAQLLDTDSQPTVQELRESVREWQRKVTTLREPSARRELVNRIAKERSGEQRSGRQISDVPDGCYYFYAKSVAPCQRMMPMIDRLNRQGFWIVKVDIGAKVELANHYKIKAVPTILIKRGSEVAKLTGVQDEQSLRSTLRQHQINDEAPGIAKKNHAEQLVIVYPVGDLLKKPGRGNGPAPKPDFDPLLHLIVSVIEPETWEESGGTGRIKPVDTSSSLVVRQTPRVHDQIKIVLNELRNLKIEAPEEEQ